MNLHLLAVAFLSLPPSVAAFAPPQRLRVPTTTTTTTTTTTLQSQVEDQSEVVSTTNNIDNININKNDTWIAKPFGVVQEEGEYASPLAQCVVGPKNVVIFDTTLRDGTQGEAISASCEDKLKIAKRLGAFEVDYIEAGWPGSNPKDAEFFRRAQTELNDDSVRSKLVAFGSTRRKNVAVQDDPQIQALVDSNVPTICMVAKAHPWQVTEILRATPEQNLEMIRDSVGYLVGLGKTVLVDLEHFFDGYAADQEYAIQCCEAAADAGASCLVMCDTNGGSMPWQVEATTKHMVEHFAPFCTIGIHCHNDCGMAVANSICAANAGAGLVQGTINGIGERTGNADLCSIIPSLALHVESELTCKPKLSELTQLSRFVDEILNRSPHNASPFVGTSAFAHKGGLHVAAMERNPLSYQHIEPNLVGNEMRVLISELSGRQNIMGKMEEIFGKNIDPSQQSARSLAILNRVKELEHQGYTFEGAEASVHLMILHSTKGYCPPFQVLDYSAQVTDHNIDSASRVVATRDNLKEAASGSSTARATIKVRTVAENDNGELAYQDNLQVSDGAGPVDALAQALLKALLPYNSYLASVELVDYKVRILDPASATEAATRVMIEFRDSETEQQWTTVSVDRNVISASLNALVDGFEYALIENAQHCMLCDDAFE
jgi:2-isopropylmalate synthase